MANVMAIQKCQPIVACIYKTGFFSMETFPSSKIAFLGDFMSIRSNTRF